MIDQITVDKIINAAQIVEVVSDFVTLRKRGVNYVGLCPFHDERTPSFSVSPAKGICKCFSCGKGGNAVNFIMEHEQVTYYEALKYLARKYHIEVIEKELTPEELTQRNDRESMLALNKFAQNYFSTILQQSSEGRDVGLAYFQERGFRDDIIKKFQLGYSLNGRDAFSVEALNKGYKKEFLVKTGLSIENEEGRLHDRFWGRVMFPIHSLSGNVVAFGGRILKKDEKAAKYVNSPESELYHKSNELYGIFFAKQAIVKQDRCFLVEGYTDVISMHQAGIENVVASSGTSLTTGQIRLIHRFTQHITVLYDGDAAGIKASLRGIDMLLEEGLNVNVVLLPDGEDPDSFARSRNASDFVEYIDTHQTNFIRFKTNLLLEDAGKDPIKRAALIGDVVRSIAIIPDSIIRSVFVKECSTLLDVDEKLLYAEIGKAHRQQQERAHSQQSSVQNAQTIQSQTDEEMVLSEGRLQAEERNILQLVVRYGEKPLFGMSVGRYVLDEMERDDLVFENPLYARMLSELKQHLDRENFIANRFFVNNPDPQISRLASDLISEKYVLSKIHSKVKQVKSEEDQLNELLPRVIFEYKNKVLLLQIKEKVTALKNANEQEDRQQEALLMNELDQLNTIKSRLSKDLGERVILKL